GHADFDQLGRLQLPESAAIHPAALVELFSHSLRLERAVERVRIHAILRLDDQPVIQGHSRAEVANEARCVTVEVGEKDGTLAALFEPMPGLALRSQVAAMDALSYSTS